MGEFTQELLVKSLPKNLKNRVTPEFVDELNGIIQDPMLRENFKENLLSYTGVMKDGRYRLDKYVSAVKYVSYRLLGSSNIESYSKTFPDRMQRLLNEGADEKTISSYVAAYNKTQLVNKIMEQTLVPTYILNAHIYQKAINVQASIMTDLDVSPKVRSDAANSLLTHLKVPDVGKMEIDVKVSHDKSIDVLKAAVRELSEKTVNSIKDGEMGAGDAAKAPLVIEDAEYEEA